MRWQKEAVQTPDYCLKLLNSHFFLGFGRLENRNSCPTLSQLLWALGLWTCSCKALKGSGQLFCSWLLISQKILSIFGKCEIFCKNSYTSGVQTVVNYYFPSPPTCGPAPNTEYEILGFSGHCLRNLTLAFRLGFLDLGFILTTLPYFIHWYKLKSGSLQHLWYTSPPNFQWLSSFSRDCMFSSWARQEIH